jgi:hypothetical protein
VISHLADARPVLMTPDVLRTVGQSDRLCDGSILRTTASLRSLQYRGRARSSSPLLRLQSFEVESRTSLKPGGIFQHRSNRVGARKRKLQPPSVSM